VLLPEAKIQILLWRDGLRTTKEPLSDQEEEALHEKGTKLLEKKYWVWELLRLKQFAERKLQRQNEMKRSITSPLKAKDKAGSATAPVGGSRTRPRTISARGSGKR
jgi:hypothetical protein